MAKSDLNEKKEEIEKLVALVQDGDHESFAVLYDLFVDPLYRYIYYRVGDEEAEDILEVVFIKVWENIHRYKAGKSSFSSWIFRIAHNLVIDHYRASSGKETQELSVTIADTDREHNPIKVTENTLNNKLLKQALNKLSKKYRDVLIYKFINQLTNREIAEIMGKTEGSIRILQFRALNSLKIELESMGLKSSFLM